ncbi:ribonuclease H-like domain-containing protein [Peribacillus frigoritolerans]|nr:ribonuclease H-like domain-containing protein [Peribacillus frigoritolerans]
MEHPLSAKGVKSEDLFFFDTETTGLGRRSGQYHFFTWLCVLEGEEVVVKQHILPQPGSEIPLYQSFLENINYETLVTYNGKSFDWPQLKTRHTLIKEHVPKLPEFGHFDLYHASRRLWRNKLERVKLSAVENRYFRCT